nr:MAG TPA: hypothetical protein [Caudoviricetes sp.]
MFEVRTRASEILLSTFYKICHFILNILESMNLTRTRNKINQFVQ